MGSDESHFNVSVGSDGQSHKTVSTIHILFEEKGEPKRVSNRGPSAYQPNALPLGHTGSPVQHFPLTHICPETFYNTLVQKSFLFLQMVVSKQSKTKNKTNKKHGKILTHLFFAQRKFFSRMPKLHTAKTN